MIIISTFIVDHENVGLEGINGIERLSKDDKIVIIHFGPVYKSLKEKLSMCNAKIEYIKQKVHTKNSLDFKIVSYAALLSERNHTERIAIVSRDKGFISAIELLQFMTSNIIILCESIEHAVNCLNGAANDIVTGYVKTTICSTPKQGNEEIKEEKRTKAFYKKAETKFRLKDDPKSAESKLIRKNIQNVLRNYGGRKLESCCEVTRVVYMISDSYDDFQNCMKIRKSIHSNDICKALKDHYDVLGK